ncbi:MAG: hypothetical protein QM820_44825 [Minicystis sp.]
MSTKDEASSHITSPSQHEGQVGPWAPGETLLLSFIYEHVEVLRVVATGTNTQMESRYLQNYEYWVSTGEQFPTKPDETVDIFAQSSTFREVDVDRFLGDRGLSDWTESTVGWIRGTIQINRDETAYLFEMNTIRGPIGLCLVFGDAPLAQSPGTTPPGLRGVGWYVQTPPLQHDPAWTPPSLGLLGNSLRLVSLDSDPSHLGPGDWYYTFQRSTIIPPNLR